MTKITKILILELEDFVLGACLDFVSLNLGIYTTRQNPYSYRKLGTMFRGSPEVISLHIYGILKTKVNKLSFETNENC